VNLVPQYTADKGQTFAVTEWRSDRIAGVVRERYAFHFCSSLSAGPYALALRESIGENPVGEFSFVETQHFRFWPAPRRLVHKPQCWNVSYSWQPRRVMVTGRSAHVLDVTLSYPVSAGHHGLLPPDPLRDHEVTSR
jgi:hypothetical protein